MAAMVRNFSWVGFIILTKVRNNDFKEWPNVKAGFSMQGYRLTGR